MPAPPTSKSFPVIPGLLALFVLAAAGGIAWLNFASSSPSRLSFLLPSSQYAAPEPRRAEAPGAQGPALAAPESEIDTAATAATTVRQSINSAIIPTPEETRTPEGEGGATPPPLENPSLQADRTEPASGTAREESTGQTDQTNLTGQTDQMDQANQADQAGQTNQADPADPSDQSNQSDQADQADPADQTTTAQAAPAEAPEAEQKVEANPDEAPALPLPPGSEASGADAPPSSQPATPQSAVPEAEAPLRDASDPDEEAAAVHSLDLASEAGALLPEAPLAPPAAASEASAPPSAGAAPGKQEGAARAPVERSNILPLSELTRRSKRAAAANATLPAPDKTASPEESPDSAAAALPQPDQAGEGPPRSAPALPLIEPPSAREESDDDDRNPARTAPLAEPASEKDPAASPDDDPARDEADLPLSQRFNPQKPAPEKPAIRPIPLARVITYGKASPAAPGSKVMRGVIHPEQIAPARPKGIAAPVRPISEEAPPEGEDSVVPLSVVDDFSRFLAANFWPRGTHPMARDHAISTAGAKWANIKFGAQLQGFAPTDDPVGARKRVLQYVFTPTGVNALYKLYSERFFNALDRDARAQSRGVDNTPLSKAQIADMYALYGNMAQGMAGAVRAYMRTPNIRLLVAEHVQASTEAHLAYRRFADGVRGRSDDSLDKAKAYQAAIMRRERTREELAAALRRHGARSGLDADSLVYVAQWLYRRGEGKDSAFSALADVLDSCAARFGAAGDQYRLGTMRSADASHD